MSLDYLGSIEYFWVFLRGCVTLWELAHKDLTFGRKQAKTTTTPHLHPIFYTITYYWLSIRSSLLRTLGITSAEAPWKPCWFSLSFRLRWYNWGHVSRMISANLYGVSSLITLMQVGQQWEWMRLIQQLHSVHLWEILLVLLYHLVS